MSPVLDSSSLRISYSGVRGIYGESLTAAVAARFGEAFARLASRLFPDPTVITGRDTRPSGAELMPAIVSGLTRLPCSLIDLGIVPSPTVQVAMAELGAQAAIIITASHNPAQWNGFKFLVGPHNIVLDGEQTAQLFELSRQADGRAPAADTAAPVARNRHEEALAAHMQRVLKHVDVAAIRSRRFKVAVDSCLGAGEDVTLRLLDNLGCDVVPVRAARDSEPIAANLGAVSSAVADNGCDIGMAQDLDADRLALVTEQGRAIGEEYTLAFAVDHLLNRTRGASPVVVKNSSTSRMIDDLCAAHDAELRVAKVGEVNLSREMIGLVGDGRVVFGGEGNGGVIFPPVCYGRDSLIGIALVLEYAAASGRRLSELAARLPQYHIIKRKLEGLSRERVGEAMSRVRRLFAGEHISEFDGLKVVFADGSWCQVRASNTEPIVRIIAESPSPEAPERLYRQVEAEIRPLLER
jgi:phosphomannomutase